MAKCAASGQPYFLPVSKQVYEADPLLCLECGGAMRIIAFIGQPAIIEKFLSRLRLWPARAHGPPEAPAA
jgi:hypothetical protein